ncbi:MAG: DNA polymerase Y family protein [Proteobacteria bacterium]|nr:MAG: DNA polymerase Y family protein [Pseudomonadota bacterium]
MLWACLHFPDFSLQLLLRGSKDCGPLAVTTGGNRPQILSCTPEARAQGVAPGMAVSAAYVLSPQLVEHARNPNAESRALEATAAWAGQFTSTVSLAPPDSLLLEIAGSLRLFGGMKPLLQRLKQEVGELGYRATLAVAPTPSAARLLACAGMNIIIGNLSKLESVLAELPLSLLQQAKDTIDSLALMGIRNIGECLQLPREGIARRFGQGLLDELDRALGRLPDPRSTWNVPARYKSRLVLPTPVHEAAPLLFAANRLILEMAGWLHMQQAGVTRLKLILHHEDRKPTVVTLSFSVPSRDPRRILALLREKLSILTLPDRVEAIVLESAEARPLDSRNLSLFPEDRLPEEERWLIIEHLRARLGSEAVHGIITYPDHRPELAWRCCEPGNSAISEGQSLPRPLWLLEQPRRLSSADGMPILDTPLALITGPEQIESGWWDDNDATRDYFVAADSNDRRFWVFHERSGSAEWFLHGVFA